MIFLKNYWLQNKSQNACATVRRVYATHNLGCRIFFLRNISFSFRSTVNLTPESRLL